MTTRLILAAVLVLAGTRVLAADGGADGHSQQPVPTCTCPCVRAGQDSKKLEGASQPQVDYGETASWPSN